MRNGFVGEQDWLYASPYWMRSFSFTPALGAYGRSRQTIKLDSTSTVGYTADDCPLMSLLQAKAQQAYSWGARKQKLMSEGTNQSASQPDTVIVKRTTTEVRLNGAMLSEDEVDFIERLRNGDEKAFVSLLQRYHSVMLRLAMIYVSKQAIAEEVVQEVWVGVLQGLNRFEGRSSLKTWIFRILTNRAKTYALREGRSVPFSELSVDMEVDAYEPAVDPERFFPSSAHRPGTWISLPENWDEIPEERLLSLEISAQIETAIEALSPNQRTVITLHDIEGWTAEEICSVLDISVTHQRVLLHRARSKVRRALERYLDEKEGA